jgi:hypothetical protein
MATLFDTMMGQLDEDSLRQISSHLGAEEAQTKSAIGMAIPTLVSALARNARGRRGRESLANALDRDHDGSLLDHLGDLLDDPSSGNGDGILGHVLGGRRGQVEQRLGAASGLDAAKIGRILVMLAPIVLAYLGRKKRQDRMDPRDIGRELGREDRNNRRNIPGLDDILGGVLGGDRGAPGCLGGLLRGGGR